MFRDARLARTKVYWAGEIRTIGVELMIAGEAVVVRVELGREDWRTEEFVGLWRHLSVDSARNGIDLCLSGNLEETTAFFHGVQVKYFRGRQL